MESEDDPWFVENHGAFGCFSQKVYIKNHRLCQFVHGKRLTFVEKYIIINMMMF